MYKLSLKNVLFEYLVKLLTEENNEYLDEVEHEVIDLTDINKMLLRSKKGYNAEVYFEIEKNAKTKLLQYVEDKQIEIGYENQDYLNYDGKKLQEIYDEIYTQTN